MEIKRHQGDRGALLPLFRIADESESEIQSYFRLGDVLVAIDIDKVIGIAQIEKVGDTAQIISLAVCPSRQGEGIGCRLIEDSVNRCRSTGASRLIVCTGAWENETISFYIKRGFKPYHIERNYFTREKGYAEAGDQIQLEMLLVSSFMTRLSGCDHA